MNANLCENCSDPDSKAKNQMGAVFWYLFPKFTLYKPFASKKELETGL